MAEMREMAGLHNKKSTFASIKSEALNKVKWSQPNHRPANRQKEE